MLKEYVPVDETSYMSLVKSNSARQGYCTGTPTQPSQQNTCIANLHNMVYI